ncbi:hypothetical protein DINM_006086 [Dirofilaria immitis]|nr:hypothetical protein [Dirofilaria immitis]MCP9262835.1 hypothetical protein [Dirofilaria immitis]
MYCENSFKFQSLTTDTKRYPNIAYKEQKGFLNPLGGFQQLMDLYLLQLMHFWSNWSGSAGGYYILSLMGGALHYSNDGNNGQPIIIISFRLLLLLLWLTNVLRIAIILPY